MIAGYGPDLPADMNAIGYDAPGGPDVLRLETVPLPRLRPDDVLIRAR
jgi:NADPH:quinone reductase